MYSEYDNEIFFSEYSKMTRSQLGLKGAGEWHQLAPLFPNLKDKSVLDLGCGYGWHCKYAVEQEAREVLGIDASQLMLEKAKSINNNEKIIYEQCGLEEYSYPNEKWDLVISNLVLHYIEDLEDIYSKVYQTLKKDGVFLFNIEHPTFTAGINQEWLYDENGEILCWPIDDYFIPGKRTTNFLGCEVVKQHHTLTQILNGLIKVGFSIEAVEEAVPSLEMMDMPGMKDELKRPMMLLVKAVKE